MIFSEKLQEFCRLLKELKRFICWKIATDVSWGARKYLYRSEKVMKMHSKVVMMSNALLFNWKYHRPFDKPFQDNGVNEQNTLQICVLVTSYEVQGLVVAKISWVDPTSFVAMNSNARLLHFTKLSEKSIDFYFLVGTHLKIWLSTVKAISK